MTKISRAELTISRSLRALAIAQRHASAIRVADECFGECGASELTTALATRRSPRSGARGAVPDDVIARAMRMGWPALARLPLSDRSCLTGTREMAA